MLPFHKRARVNSSIEIDAEDLEAIELPQVRPPSVRPGAFIPKSPMRQRFESLDDEMTVVRMDKRVSTSPPPRVDLQIPRMPASRVPRFERPLDDEPTQMHPSSRPLLTMSSTPPRSVFVAESNHFVPPAPVSSRRLVEEAPRSTAAVDASSSAHVRAVDLSMTSSLSGSTDIRKLRRPTMGWATGLVALGVFAGIITAFVARGEGLATAAAFIDPSHSVTADVAKVAAAQPQAPVMAPGAAVVQAPQVAQQKPAAPSCNADAVPAKSEAKADAKVEAKEAKETAKAEKAERAEPKPEVKLVQKPAYVAPVRHVEREPAAVAVSNPPPAITKPVAKPARHASSNDVESASAADALAKAQLEAALSR